MLAGHAERIDHSDSISVGSSDGIQNTVGKPDSGEKSDTLSSGLYGSDEENTSQYEGPIAEKEGSFGFQESTNEQEKSGLVEDETAILSDSERFSIESFLRNVSRDSLSSFDSSHRDSLSIIDPLEYKREERRGSTDSGTALPPKRRPRRRKSNKSDASERSNRSSIKNSEHVGSGYTLAPATGKIFRNLLILEESLRTQVIQQRAFRRKYLMFLSILFSLIAAILYELQRIGPESSSRSALLKLSLVALLVTFVLYHLSGEYQKTIVLPRKFLSSTNKGLRQFNVRLVKIKMLFTDTIIDYMREIVLYFATLWLDILYKSTWLSETNVYSRLEYFLVSCKLQCQPRAGLTDVKLVLNSRVFSKDIREGWELYRNEFWVMEGVRRREHMMASVRPRRNSADKEKGIRKEKREKKHRSREPSILVSQGTDD